MGPDGLQQRARIVERPRRGASFRPRNQIEQYGALLVAARLTTQHEDRELPVTGAQPRKQTEALVDELLRPRRRPRHLKGRSVKIHQGGEPVQLYDQRRVFTLVIVIVGSGCYCRRADSPLEDSQVCLIFTSGYCFQDFVRDDIADVR